MRPITSALPEMRQEGSKLSRLWPSVAVGEWNGKSWEDGWRHVRRHEEIPKGGYHPKSA